MEITLDQSQVLQALRLYAQALTGMEMNKASYFIYKEAEEWVVKIKLNESQKLPEPKFQKKTISPEEVEKVYAPVAKRTPDVT